MPARHLNTPKAERIDSCACFDSSYELIHVFGAQASPFEVFASQPELRVDIVVANGFAGLVHVNQRSMQLEQRDHLVPALLHHQSVDFSGWFINKVTLVGRPIVLEIAPGTTQHEPSLPRRLLELCSSDDAA